MVRVGADLRARCERELGAGGNRSDFGGGTGARTSHGVAAGRGRRGRSARRGGRRARGRSSRFGGRAISRGAGRRIRRGRGRNVGQRRLRGGVAVRKLNVAVERRVSGSAVVFL